METRTITLGRNRLNTIEHWVKPAKPSRARAAQTQSAATAPALNAAPASHPETARAQDGVPRPVSQFVRTTTLAAHR
jgi:hypothetical protein